MKPLSFDQLNFSSFGYFITPDILSRFCEKLPKKILDLGCGTGKHLVEVSKIFQHAELTGIDISEENIAEAKKTFGKTSTTSFYACDYLHFQSEPFDIIYAESVLHLIVANSDHLYAKLSNDLAHKGILIITMPYDCFYNRVLIGFRKILRKIRSKPLDKAFLVLAKLIYPKVSSDILKDRIPYMYMTPERIDSSAFRATLREKYRLTVVESSPCKSTSIAKPKHKLIVFQKE